MSVADTEIDRLREDIAFDADLLGRRLRFRTTWGLFSPRAIDAGTALLLEHLDVPPAARALDIGCGYGPLGLAIASACPDGRVDLVDRDVFALEYSAANATLNGLDNVSVYASNGLSAVPAERRYDLIVSNLPAKVGNELFRIMFHDMHRHLEPGGRVVVVTINGLRDFIKREFKASFGNYAKLKQGPGYTVSSATREA